MGVLTAGRWRVTIDGTRLDRAYGALDAFLRTVSQHPGRDDGADCHIELLAGECPARAVVDPGRKHIRMHLPLAPAADLQVACIAVLQAAFRGLALLSADPSLVLLHGSAVAAPYARGGIAVIDGGTGAGKTSLSLALAERGCLLINDEFLLCESSTGQLTAFCQPKLPWHIRADMAPHLAVGGHRPGFYPFPHRTAAGAVPLKALVIPDWSLPAGTYTIQHGQPPDTCVADHLQKFASPRLDHVSLYSGQPGAVTATEDACLNTLVEQRIAAMRRSLQGAASSLRLVRAGIGAPAEVGLAAEAVLAYLERLP
jgi:hypothetical protein